MDENYPPSVEPAAEWPIDSRGHRASPTASSVAVLPKPAQFDARGSGVQTTSTTCPYCGVGCGVLADVAADGAVSVRGDPDHPANYGRLCSKGSALAETLSLDDRLLHPEIDGRRVGWDEALDCVAERFSAAIAEHGPDSVAFYVSGQLMTEDYYVANKLMKGFIGSGNIDTNSRLCMSSAVAGHKRAFGSDTVPGVYTDLEEADLIVLVGSNFAWCHPVLFQRMMAAREKRGTRLVVIDPRRTSTAEAADLHLAIAPDGDIALFNGLLRHLADTVPSPTFVEAHTTGVAQALEAAADLDLAAVAHATGLAIADMTAFYRLFGQTERVVTVFSQGVNQSICATDKVNAIINCHLVTGRIGRPGMGPFSITGQPNAMGGREVGGLANQLAAHLDIDNTAHRALVGQFWKTERLAAKPGLKAVDLFRAVADGRIKALWIIATNPVDSLPDADRVRAALQQCPFVVCSDVVRHTDTTSVSHVLLPAAAWGEKDGTVTNSDRRISRQRSFLPLPGDARPDWWIVSQVAARMGYRDAFDFATPAAVFREHAGLSAAGNDGTRDFDLSGLADLDSATYDSMAPVQWPVLQSEAPDMPGIDRSTSRKRRPDRRFFGDGRFFTPDGRARFVPVHAPAAQVFNPDYPLTLNTGRIRDQWHTMTRTAKSVRLSAHLPEPYLSLHPADAGEAGIAAGQLVICESPYGQMVVRAQVGTDQRRGSVFAPMHWTDQFASAARVDALVPGRTDPISGQPASKNVSVRIRPFAAAWYGFMLTRPKARLSGLDYWAAARIEDGWQFELAGREEPEDWSDLGRRLLGLTDDTVRVITYDDTAAKQHRMAVMHDGRLEAALFVAPTPLVIARSFLAEALRGTHSDAEALRLLAGRPGAGRPNRGETVCACFQIGVNQIRSALGEGGCATVGEIGAALKAGTNCGSCRPEIQRIIELSAA